MLILLSLLAPSAHAQADVFHHLADPALVEESPVLHPIILQALTDAGSTGVDEQVDFPFSLAQYSVVILTATTLVTPPTYDAPRLRQFMDRGGWLIILGDNNNFTNHNEAFNVLLDDLGSSMRLQETLADNNCGIIATLEDPYHPLMLGVTGITYASQAEVVPGNGDILVTSFVGEPLVVVEDRLVLAGDASLVFKFCEDELVPGNGTLLANIYGSAGICSDVDGDGYVSIECDGGDCDDTDAAISPAAVETYYDGVDQDCSGGSDFDRDGDGFDSDLHGGDDCDDTDPDTYLDAPERYYDGVDQDCRGGSDYDRDGDGFNGVNGGGDDCDDINLTINPAAMDIPGDGIDQDCDGADATTGDSGGGEGCGCAAPAPWSGALGLALLALVGMRRRT